MSNLKDLLNKIRVEAPTPVKEEGEMDDMGGDEEQYDGPICYYLNEDGTCSDGCSCADVSIEQECPFMSEGNFEECCCYEESQYEEDDQGEMDEDDSE